MREEFQRNIIKLFDDYSPPISGKQAEQMGSYYEFLLETNKRFNLTAITGPKEAALLHFFDSAFAAPVLPEGATVVDVGSGAGFPAAPIAIVRPDIDMTALESAAKKCGFIKEAAQKAGINMTVVNERAEEHGRGEGREAYDVCVSRAVTALPALLELCIPLVKIGGIFLAYKADDQKELASVGNATEVLGAKLEKRIKLPIEGYDHTVLVFRKTEKTPQKYPRNFGQIKKSPL